jgi:predicted tellurium resistance membrane protein TerC
MLLVAAAFTAVALAADPAVSTAVAPAVAAADPAAHANLFSGPNIAAFFTLTAMEIVLGIDNIVFIAILCARLPEEQREKARLVGLALAMFMRIGLLFTIKWIMGLTGKTLFTLPILNEAIDGRDLVLLLGGLFLIYKATKEIHAKVEHEEHIPGEGTKSKTTFRGVIGQILVIDLVFSLDSVITAVGMAQNLWIMVAAVVVSVGVMLAVSGKISRFIDKNPTLKMLALAFLLLIGVMLVAESLGQHINKGYIYFAMAFSLGVEGLNMLVKKKASAGVRSA